MVWFRIDDGFGTSRKVLQIPKRRRPAAVGVWTLAGAWCARELTDGYIPRYALDEIPSGSQYAADLVSVGLWDVTDDGWVFHDWQEYQPSKDDVLKERERHAARQKAYRERRAAERDASRNASRDGAVTVPSVTRARPDPTRPDPTVVPTELPKEQPSPSVRVRATRLPADWQPTLDLIEFVRTECPAVNGRAETENFVDYWHAKAGKDATKLDWPATYRRWMRTAQERTPHGNAPVNGYRPSTSEIRAGQARSLADEYRAAEQAAENTHRLELHA